MVQLTFLGTNGWYDSSTGNTICAFIESKEHIIILDAGFGIQKIYRYIPSKTKKSVSMFLSHFHIDHIVGIHTINKIECKQLKIFGPKGMKKALNNIIRPPYTFNFKDLSYPIEIIELKDERWYNIPFDVNTRYLRHSTTCMGYRFELDGKTIAYCTDTGVCPGLKTLAKGVDLLILECSYLSGERHPQWPHMNPEECGRVAKEGGVGKLVLTHFDAGRYDTMAKREEAGRIAKRIFRNTTVGKDGLKIEI